MYLHIPFCARKCNYCDFLSFSADAGVQQQYIDQLKRELLFAAASCSGKSISSVFIGGGTPSVISESSIAELLSVIRDAYELAPDAEISIECNPGSTMRHKFASYRRAGINRLSLGLQSADNAELKMLGRIHSFEEFLKSYQGARMEGFDNINIDLINCIPLQRAESWKKTLNAVTMLRPEHISVYNLILEEGTPFYKMHEQGFLKLPDEEEQALIDDFTLEFLGQKGYEHYEISNWARPGRECRHNCGYWNGTPYLGFGLGAASCFANTRWSNVREMERYLSLRFDDDAFDPDAELRREKHALSRRESAEEFMYLGLRMARGVDPADFYGRFGLRLEQVYGQQLAKAVEEGLMEKEEGRYHLSRRGMFLSNRVLAEFLLDEEI